MHGKISIVSQRKKHEILKNIPGRFKVTRYHSLELRIFPDSLEVILEEENGAVMSFSHRYLPIVGIQFHPEAHLTEYGEQLILNWVNLINELKVPQIHY